VRNLKTWCLPAVLSVLLCACGEGKSGSGGNTGAGGDGGAAGGGGAPASGPEIRIDPATTGSIRGTVTFRGTPRTPGKNAADADPVCHRMHPGGVVSESYVVGNDGALANIYVAVKGAPKGRYPAPGGTALFDQAACVYVPHILAVQAGQKVEIRNSDDTAHNVHSLGKLNPEFNIAMPGKGSVFKTFESREAIKFKCDIHGWMSAIIYVSDHPFFSVTGADGSFSIAGVPAGEYELEATHEKMGTRTVKVRVEAGKEASAGFTFEEEGD